MNILLLYETYSSGTETAATIVADILTSKNHTVTTQKAHTIDPTSLSTFDVVILASPSWWVDEKDGQPHINYKEFLAKSAGLSFSGKNFAIIGLGDSTFAHFCGAVDELEKFVTEHQGSLMVESLRIDSFYFDRDTNDRLLTNWVDNLAQKLS